jgi:transcription elongation GreA/GreB family factor
MVASPAELPEEVVRLIDQKQFDAIEDVWTKRMEIEPRDFSFFFGVASAVKKKGGISEAVSWLRFLADYLAEKNDPDAWIDVLLEIARISPSDEKIRGELADAFRSRYAAHPSLAAVLAQNSLEKATDVAAVGQKIRRWLAFLPGQILHMPGRGPGSIVEMNPALDVIRLDFSGTKLPFSLVSAEKTLAVLPEGHFLRERVERPEETRELAEREPAEAVRRLLASFGRPIPLSELKEHFAGVISEAKWSAFWAGARKHKQLLVSGTGKSATVAWSTSSDAAEESIREAFARASPAERIDLARKHGKRSKELAREFALGLVAEARLAAPHAPALAWELSQAAVRLAPEEPETFPAEELLASGNILTLLGQIRDQVSRSKALEAIRARRDDWIDLFAEQFLCEEDQRVLATIFQELPEEKRMDLTRRILRSPRMAPRAFVWLCEGIGSEEPVPPALFSSLLDALRQEEFSSVRARVKEFFDPGGLAVVLVRSAESEEQAREMLHALNRAGGLEEHRRATVREALLMKFPELRAPAREYLYSTAEAIEGKRQELQHLKSVELPANAEAMRAAKDHGDLSENFEYHAARQRHEYLSARIASLADELSRARALDPSRIEVSEVRVGTRVRLRDIATGLERAVTILGPWDSRPEEAIYSYQSEFAQALLGQRTGDRVRFSDEELEVAAIEPWRT